MKISSTMDVDTPVDAEHEIKAEGEAGDAKMAEDKPTYRSWKKKYRKMRILFDQKMHQGEDLYRQEQKALATARRLAIEKDQLLDLLLDVNSTAQIPYEKRFDLRIDPPSEPDGLGLDMDKSGAGATAAEIKSYKQLLADIPHTTYATAPDRFPDLFADLEAGRDSSADASQAQNHPPSFLSADDIDDYIWEVDTRLSGTAASSLLPTLAPAAQASNLAAANGGTNGRKDAIAPLTSSSRDFALRNPTSVYNWLRKHAPKTFLQDAETNEKDKDTANNNGEEHAPPARATGRAAKGERGSGGGRASLGGSRSKRASAAHSRDKHAAVAENAEKPNDEPGHDAETPTTGAGKGKRKRVVDDDPGYRPKGGSSRAAKKKRRSDGIEVAASERTPTSGPKKSRKSAGTTDTAMKDADD